MTYNYNRSKVAGDWGRASDKFVDRFKKLTDGEFQDFRRSLGPKVEKLVDQFQKELGEGWEFQRGASAASVARAFIDDVMSGENAQPYDDWLIDNFFRQGYMMIEKDR